MQSVQRQFGRFGKRSADNQTVSVLLKDFEDADQLLSKIIDASKAWRESWISILTYQSRLFAEFEILYHPIIGAADDYEGHKPILTPEKILSRTDRIKLEYEDLKKDLSEELGMVEPSMIRPAQDAKESLQTFRKTIKKREDRKLDFERYQGRVDTSQKKTKRTDRENASYAKSQSDLVNATEAYNAADEHLRKSLPPILAAVFSILPLILAAQIRIQNNLLAHYYTMLHTFCTEEGFPSPSPPMDEVIRVWDDKIRTVIQDIESIGIVASGKTARLSISQENGHAYGNTNGYRRPSANSSSSRVPSVSPARPIPPFASYDTKPKISSSPSYDSRPRISSSPSAGSLLSPQHAESTVTSPSPSLSAYQTPSGFPLSGPNTDYFSRDRKPSATSLSNFSAHSSNNITPAQTPGGTVITAATIAAKKRPPPPPPRMNSQQAQFQFVIALYDFSGQGDGDLAFKEGDRIKVIKKTESTDDWWQGELRGVKGAFPANYVQA